MIEAAYQNEGMNARFITCEVGPETLSHAINGAIAMGWKGFSCSLPNKQEVIQYLDDLDTSAQVIGAVNCVVIKEGKLTGYNTDGKGFIEALCDITSVKGKHITLLGAGGAARAIAVEAALAGAKHITLVNRNQERGEALVKLIEENTKAKASFVKWTKHVSIESETEILVNATSIGLNDAQAIPDIDMDSLHKEMIIADVIPNPPETKLLREAAKKGCTTLNGLNMLVNQGAQNIYNWFGKKVDREPMKASLKEIFEAK
ncbi:shikimate dehydrogenase [Rosenbergiella australiborealis]|uniref:shikimate dehydrogenase (NADP(+)) n=2 Tax=Rosenbergiella australiborealis TaxID=1544696 RepID=A0ABS5T3X2_9GAMM|nr:shikimate dehydrogenase [Rosenbergiella australiborealis]MBT0727057.1 shikimate dehydrogenase [Rosenbergiella australiborealis]